MYILLVLVILALQEFKLALILTSAFFFTLIVTVLIRILYFKNRPKKQSFRNFIEKMEASSFPSWHSTRAIFLALIFGTVIGSRIAMLILIIIALLVAYSRIYLKKHDWMDILAGIVLGIFTYWLALVVF